MSSLSAVGKQTAIYSIGNIGLRTSALLLLPLYTRNLSQSDFGLLSLVLITIQVYVTLINTGVRESIVRFSKNCIQEGTFSHLIGSGFVIVLAQGIAISALTYLFMMPVLRSVLHSSNTEYAAILICVTALSQAVFQLFLAYYQARQMAVNFMVFGLGVSGMLIVATVISIYAFHGGVYEIIVAQTLVYVAFSVIVGLVVIRKTGLSISKALILRIYRYSVPLMFTTTAFVVMEGSPLYFIGHFSTLEMTAIYSLGSRLAGIVRVILMLPLQLSLQPFVYSNLDNSEIRNMLGSLANYSLVAFAVLSFAILSGSRMIMSALAPDQYAASLQVLLLLLPVYIWSGMYVFGYTLYHIKNKTHRTAIFVLTFTFISLAANYILIPLYGYNGAIITSNAASFGIGLSLFVAGLKVQPIRMNAKHSIGTAIVILFIFIMFYLIRNSSSSTYYSYVAMGAGVVICVFWVSGIMGFENKYNNNGVNSPRYVRVRK